MIRYEVRTTAPNAENPLHVAASLDEALVWLSEVAREQAADGTDIPLVLMPVQADEGYFTAACDQFLAPRAQFPYADAETERRYMISSFMFPPPCLPQLPM